jgi:hypothetical protein
MVHNGNTGKFMVTEILRNIIAGAPGRYDMFSLEIEIEGKTVLERTPTIFHEYTHYLQNMTTINGFISLDKYIHVLLRSFTKLGSDTVNPKIPLNNYPVLQNVLGDKNVGNILSCRSSGMDYDVLNKKYVFQDTDLEDYSVSEQDHMDHYSGILLKIPYIAIDGKNIPLNEITIKENMALVNSIIGGNKNDKLTTDDINEILSYEYKEYNVLFDFINHYLPNCNLLKLVYCICEISLNIYFSEQVMGNMLRLIQKESEYLSEMETDTIICLMRDAINYDEISGRLYNIIYEKAIIKTLELFDSFDLSENQFVYILKDFYCFLIKGIKYRSGQKTLYVNYLTDNYIQILTSIIGCPIIYFTEEKKWENLSRTPEYFFKDFIYLHGALKIFMRLYDSDIFVCPFFDSNLCTVSKNERCSSNCLDNYHDSYYRNCLLSNALICTGIRQEERRA